MSLEARITALAVSVAAQFNGLAVARSGIRLGGAISADDVFYVVLEANTTFGNWQIESSNGTSGSVVFDVWATTDGTQPAAADAITNGNQPAMVASTNAVGTTTGFSTTVFSRGDRIAIKINSATLTEVYFSLTA